MRPEDHVVDDCFVYEISDFDEARHSGHHAEDRHFGLVSEKIQHN